MSAVAERPHPRAGEQVDLLVSVAGELVLPEEVLDRLHLEPGDKVLVAGAGSLPRAVILGRIGAPRAVEKLMTELPATEPPDELVLEAKHSLTLRVGEGSITIREDGKILIKGRDLVSHAQRLNRIRGGAVSIN
jgi:hypothetical protein